MFFVPMLEETGGKGIKFQYERFILHSRKLSLTVKNNEVLENSGVSIFGDFQKHIRQISVRETAVV